MVNKLLAVLSAFLIGGAVYSTKIFAETFDFNSLMKATSSSSQNNIQTVVNAGNNGPCKKYSFNDLLNGRLSYSNSCGCTNKTVPEKVTEDAVIKDTKPYYFTDDKGGVYVHTVYGDMTKKRWDEIQAMFSNSLNDIHRRSKTLDNEMTEIDLNLEKIKKNTGAGEIKPDEVKYTAQPDEKPIEDYKQDYKPARDMITYSSNMDYGCEFSDGPEVIRKEKAVLKDNQKKIKYREDAERKKEQDRNRKRLEYLKDDIDYIPPEFPVKLTEDQIERDNAEMNCHNSHEIERGE